MEQISNMGICKMWTTILKNLGKDLRPESLIKLGYAFSFVLVYVDK